MTTINLKERISEHW